VYWLFSCAPADIVFGFGFCLLFTACDCITGSPAKRTLRQVRTQISGLECLSNENVTWNRLADRRDIIMGMKIAKDNSDYSEVTMRITPEKTTFVQISENCSDKVNVIVLNYINTWRNIGVSS